MRATVPFTFLLHRLMYCRNMQMLTLTESRLSINLEVWHGVMPRKEPANLRKKIAEDLVEIYAKRMQLKGYRFSNT